MVGEMRDQETASIAVEAALTRHLVFSTLHTNSAPETVSRLLEIGIDRFSFSDSLVCVLAQRLARVHCSHCRAAYLPDAREIDELVAEVGDDFFRRSGWGGREIVLSRPVGCPACSGSGYRGRIGMYEMLVCTDSVRALVKGRADTQRLREAAVAEGMPTLKQDGLLKVLEGKTDVGEVRRVCLV